MDRKLNHALKDACRTIGYARVLTEDQHLDLQINALKLAGCSAIFEDRGVSATAKRRPGFEQALSSLQAGDVFVVWKMDRAFRSLKNALNILEEFENRGIEFRCLTEDIDTPPPWENACTRYVMLLRTGAQSHTGTHQGRNGGRTTTRCASGQAEKALTSPDCRYAGIVTISARHNSNADRGSIRCFDAHDFTGHYHNLPRLWKR